MPRKHEPKFAESKIPTIDPKDRHAVDDHVLVRHVLVDFDKVSVLPDDVRDRLVEALVAAVRIARGGVKVGKRHLSNKATTKHIFLCDVGRAMELAGLRVTWWRKHDHGGGESLYFQIAHALSDRFVLRLPQDLRPLAVRAAQIQYGTMSAAMKAAQDAELAARRQRLDLLVLRLKAPLAAWQHRLDGLLARLRRQAPLKQGGSVTP